MTSQPVSGATFESLRQLDTCTASNAIERLNVRLRNEGFVADAVECLFPKLPPLLGYAGTARIRTSSAPMAASCYYDRMDWWSYLATLPEPRVMVIEDVDHKRGFGALVGEIHAVIAQALNCVGCITNGAVRDLAAVEKLGFSLFAARAAVSHSYAHIIDFGDPVELGGLVIHPGDLMHADRNGVHVIPLEIAAEVPSMARHIQDEERKLVDFCRSRDFSLQDLSERMRPLSEKIRPSHPTPTEAG